MSKKDSKPVDTSKLAEIIPIQSGIAEVSKYKVGEWAYYAAGLFQIQKLNNAGEVIQVTDGKITISAFEGKNLEEDLRPLNAEVKAASEVINQIQQEFSKYSETARLNVQDIYPVLTKKWKELIGAKEADANNILGEIDSIRKAIVGTIEQLHALKFPLSKDKTIEIQLFK